jgi:phage gp29-like protein
MNKSLDTPYYGYIVFGSEWGIINGKFIPIKIEAMPHRLVKFDMKGELLVSNDGFVFNKPEHPARYIVLQHKPTMMNPYGEPLLSRCFWNIMFKKDARKWWAIFAEKFGMPWAVGEYDPKLLASQFSTTTQLAANKFLDQITNMVKDGVLAHPKGTTLNLIQGAAKGSTDIYESLVRICDEQNTKLILGHSGASESTSGDKLNNDTTATDVRDSVIESDKQYPTYLFNNIIQWIHSFNFNSKAPQFILYKKEDVDLTIAQRDAALQPVLSASGLGYSDKYFIKTYGFEQEDLIKISQNDAVKSQNLKANIASAPKLMNLINNAASKDEGQEAIDGLDEYIESDLADNNAAIMDDMLKPLLKLVEESGSIEVMLEKYTDLFDQMDNKQILDLITNITQISHIHGSNCQHINQLKKVKNA